MARPARNNAVYFTHDANLRNDRRIKAIRTQCGAIGYGLLHMLLEALTDADFTQLSTDEEELELLAGDFGVSVTEIDSLLQIGEKVKFFSRNEAGLLICPDLNTWLTSVFEKRNRARNSGKTDKPGITVTETTIPVTVIPQSKEKESKEILNSISESKLPPTPGGVFEKKRGGPVAEKLDHLDPPDESPPVAAAPPMWEEEARELAAGMYGLWSITHQQADAQARVLRFVKTIYAGGQGPTLLAQFVAYRDFKKQRDEPLHGWKTYLGSEARAYADGAWNELDWTAKLTAYRQSCSHVKLPHRPGHGPASAGRVAALDASAYGATSRDTAAA